MPKNSKKRTGHVKKQPPIEVSKQRFGLTILNKIYASAFVLLFIAIGTLYFYKLVESFNFHPDFARDINDILTISRGHLSLLGTKTSFGGYYQGPFYYYLFVPVFFISRESISVLLYFHALIYIAALAYLSWVLYREHGLWKSLLGTLIIALVPVYFTTSRTPWNGSTYLPFLLVFLALVYFRRSESPRYLAVLGLLGGFIVSTHYANAALIVLLLLIVSAYLKKRIYVLYVLAGFLVPFLPLLLFEMTHHWIMYKNTFVDRSYQMFMGNQAVAGTARGHKNLIENIQFIEYAMKPTIVLSPVILLLVSLVALIKRPFNRKSVFVVSNVISFVVIAYLLRFQIATHYMYPVSFAIFVLTVFAVLERKWFPVLILLVVLELQMFPKYLYWPSHLKPESFDRTISRVVQEKLISPADRFNVFQLSKTFGTNAPYGDEYRYFFRKKHFTPLSKFEYAQSDSLFIFTDIPSPNLGGLRNWEIDQFGKQYVKDAKRYELGGGLYLFKAVKTGKNG